MQKEIAVLKKNLLQKSQEIDGLKLRNDQFQSGIDSLQPRVASPVYEPSSFPSNPRQTSYEPIRLSTPDIQLSSESCSLEFDAVVTLLNGKSKEVFYTEFFLLSQSFPDLLFNGGIFLKDFPGLVHLKNCGQKQENLLSLILKFTKESETSCWNKLKKAKVTEYVQISMDLQIS